MHARRVHLRLLLRRRLGHGVGLGTVDSSVRGYGSTLVLAGVSMGNGGGRVMVRLLLLVAMLQPHGWCRHVTGRAWCKRKTTRAG